MTSTVRASIGLVLAAIIGSSLTGCGDESTSSASAGSGAAAERQITIPVKASIGARITPATDSASPASHSASTASGKTSVGSTSASAGDTSTITSTGAASSASSTSGTGASASGTITRTVTAPVTPGSGPSSGASGAPASGEVAPVTLGPVITGSPATSVVAGTSYKFQPVATDTSGAAMTFGVVNKPKWATFDSTTGALSGKPTRDNVGVFAQIVISASDGTHTASMAPFTVSVTAPKTADSLTIMGSPMTTATVGSAYSFKPMATDSDNSKLAFSIANKPAWATFDSTTGALSGTPVVASVGVTSQIQISVSDGTTSASLSAFSLEVKSGSQSSVSITWTAPTQNVNGTSTTDLAGYHVYYGTSEKDLTTVVTVNKASDTDQVIGNLKPGTYYFAVTSYNTAKVESAMSAIVPVTI